MGRQTGVIRIEGSVGNLTFVKSEDGDLVRLKGGVSGDRLRTDRRFARTRENWSEFARAGKATKMLRQAFSKFIRQCADLRSSSRLMSATMKVIKSDPINPRGERLISAGDFNFLTGFEFNIRQNLPTALALQLGVTIDRVAGTASLGIPDFIPELAVKPPVGATHASIFGMIAEVNWETGEYTATEVEGAVFETNTVANTTHNLQLTFSAGSVLSLATVCGIAFYQVVNGQYYLLQDGAKNAMQLLGVDNI